MIILYKNFEMYILPVVFPVHKQFVCFLFPFQLWLERLESSKAVELPPPASAVDQATNREYRHPTTGDTNHSSTMNNKHPAGIKTIQNRVQQPTNSGVSTFNNYSTATSLNPSLLSNASSITQQFVRGPYSVTPTVNCKRQSISSKVFVCFRIRRISVIRR